MHRHHHSADSSRSAYANFFRASTLISPVAGSISTKSTSAPQYSQFAEATNVLERSKAITWPKAQRKTSNVKSASGTINCYTMLSTDLGCHPCSNAGIAGPCVRKGLRSTDSTAAISASDIVCLP